MKTNLDKYKSDLISLINKGSCLLIVMKYECDHYAVRSTYKKADMEHELNKILEKYDSFNSGYQSWYSEAIILIRFLIPDRLDDFMEYYKRPKNRKLNDTKPDNYTIQDYLESFKVTSSDGWEKKTVASPLDAVPKFEQQLNILKSANLRFESSLFDIKQLVQADLFDSELATAKELLKKKFARAAGVIAGVVLEKHLAEVCINHSVVVKKKAPSINDYNQLLKDNEIVDIPDWRRVQLLGDIRNTCGHNKDKEPTIEDVEDLISGVEKVIKTIF